MQTKTTFLWLVFLMICISGLAACTSRLSSTEALSPFAPVRTNTLTFTPASTSTLTPVPPTATHTPSLTPSPTITLTPGSLPTFQAAGLYSGVSPASYIPSTCQYLYSRWNLMTNSQPGTVVVPVMFHSIAGDTRPAGDVTTITESYFHSFMDHAAQLGFQTITTAQLADFLENNAKIPPRSMILIVDDRKRAQYFTTFFEPYQKKYGWTVTNAWISHPDTPAYLWNENAALVPTGLVDFQAHGVIHNIPIEPDSSDAFIHTELYGPLTAMLDHFGSKPIAYIWPRGLFTAKAVQVARQAGYQLGFSSYPRGPLLFNWIPIGEPERQVNDPLMVLPRSWDTTALTDLDKAVAISQAAQAFANQNKGTETGYYAQYCKNYPGPLP